LPITASVFSNYSDRIGQFKAN